MTTPAPSSPSNKISGSNQAQTNPAQATRVKRTRKPDAGGIDLSTLATNPEQLSKLEISRPEAPEERVARIQRENWTHLLNIIREAIIFITGIALVGIICFYCISIALNTSSSPDNQKWAQSILTLVVGAVIGYLVGKGGQK